MLPLHLRRGFGGQHHIENEIDNNEPPPLTPSQARDLNQIRFILQWKLKKLVPPELVDSIIDAAEYWPSTKNVMDGQRTVRFDRDQVLLKTVPLCFERKSLERLASRTESEPESGSGPGSELQTESAKPLPHRTAHPCRKIIFHIKSHDQGSARIHEDMYQGSFTWFDAEVIHEAHKKKMYVDGTEQEILDDEGGRVKKHFEPSDAHLLPRSKQVQMNGARVSETQDREITWHYLDGIEADSTAAHDIERRLGRGRYTLDGRVVRELEVGDSIALWGRARFGQWANHVFEASVRVFWAI
ncbi:hypothetical protein N7450_001078 [Penicillium hetheringtonii]|uniref:Uncharacterized protein n=1 Tax=Penicillium hetheringtonii TaxID=911720 RepID=A0AAD6E3Z1_9EURO|nr:hypothetical protein N7450_001078 [Penicillium hetheringtonii]